MGALLQRENIILRWPKSSEHFSHGLIVDGLYVAPLAYTMSCSTIEMDDAYFSSFPSCLDLCPCFLAARRIRRSPARRHSVRLHFESTSVGVRMRCNIELDFAWFWS